MAKALESKNQDMVASKWWSAVRIEKISNGKNCQITCSEDEMLAQKTEKQFIAFYMYLERRC